MSKTKYKGNYLCMFAVLLITLLVIGLAICLMPTVHAAEEEVTTWNTSGTCEWGIDPDGCLWIRPTDGVSGTLATWGFYSPPWYSSRYSVRSVVVKQGVQAATCHNMFMDCYRCVSMDLSGLDTSNVTDMSGMFSECGGLTSLDVSGLNTSNVTNMNCMFYGCSGLKSLDISNFDMSAVTNVGGMFQDAIVFGMSNPGSTTGARRIDQDDHFSLTFGENTSFAAGGIPFYEIYNTYVVFKHTDPATGIEETMSVSDMNTAASPSPGVWEIEVHITSAAGDVGSGNYVQTGTECIFQNKCLVLRKAMKLKERSHMRALVQNNLDIDKAHNENMQDGVNVCEMGNRVQDHPLFGRTLFQLPEYVFPAVFRGEAHSLQLLIVRKLFCVFLYGVGVYHRATSLRFMKAPIPHCQSIRRADFIVV